MSSLINLTPQQLRQAANLQEKITELQADLAKLLGAAAPAGAPAKRRGKISAAGIARIRAAAKARWARERAAKGKKPEKKKRTLSAAARARLAALARARWAKAKAQGRKRL
jgi:hypothetical protein